VTQVMERLPRRREALSSNPPPHTQKKPMKIGLHSLVQWLMSIIPATWKAEVGESRVQGHLGQLMELCDCVLA
jgi:hypothetical protein